MILVPAPVGNPFSSEIQLPTLQGSLSNLQVLITPTSSLHSSGPRICKSWSLQLLPTHYPQCFSFVLWVLNTYCWNTCSGFWFPEWTSGWCNKQSKNSKCSFHNRVLDTIQKQYFQRLEIWHLNMWEENKEVTKAHVQCDPNHACCLKSTLKYLYNHLWLKTVYNRGPVWHTSIIRVLGQWPTLKKHLFIECGDWNSENYRPHKNMRTNVHNSFICNRPQKGAT